MNEAELGYLAGMIDADGSIGIYRQGKYYCTSVKISNTRKAIIDRCTDILDAHGVKYCITVRDRGGNRKKEWLVDMNGRPRCKAVLDLILPYLAGKVDQAEAVLSMCHLDGVSIGSEDADALRCEVLKLNRKGRLVN